MEQSLDAVETQATPPSQGMIPIEATPPSSKVKDTDATPASLELIPVEATPPSLELINRDANPSFLVNVPSDVCELVDDFTELNKHYLIYERIRSGGFGVVHLGLHILTGDLVAIKMMKKEDVCDTVWLEIDAMVNLHHQNVCQLYHVIETPNFIHLVLEYCPRGDLYKLITKKKRLSEKRARQFFRQIVSGLAYIHSQGYAHRNLKPENLLLDEHFNIKITNFGFCAKSEGGLGSPVTTFCGTPPFIAPELYEDKPYIGSEADVWSLGVVLYEMLCGYLPYDDQNSLRLYRKMVSGQFDTPDWLSLNSICLLKQMLQVNPTRRVTVEQLLDHQWVMEGYNSPVEWHSTRLLYHLDNHCIYLMAALLGLSKQRTAQLVSECEYDHIMATYLLLLGKAHSLREAHSPSAVAAQTSTRFSVHQVRVQQEH